MLHNRLKEEIVTAIQRADLKYSYADITIEHPKNSEYGDISTPVALRIAKSNNQSPMEIASKITANLKPGVFQKADILKPGFINFRYSTSFLKKMLKQLLLAEDSFFQPDYGAQKRVILEFVSVNPTGPLHIGHGRGAAYGDSLARIMKFCGYNVFKEYYINDAGNQMAILGQSVMIRLMQLKGIDIALPDDFYKGDYIKDISKQLLDSNAFPDISEAWLASADMVDTFSTIAGQKLMDLIKNDLRKFNVRFDNYFSELSLHKSGEIKKTLLYLKAQNLTETKDNALWFRSKKFGDDKNRVLVRANGTPTYFAADIAYHKSKFDRNFDLAIDIWGQDHHGYVKRLTNAIDLIGYKNRFKVILYQLVALKGYKLSTRQGNFVTLKELISAVGTDAARFFFVLRSHNGHLDFDVDLAMRKSSDNPVFYVQYAYARINSIFKKYGSVPNWNNLEFNRLNEKEILDIIKELLFFPNLLTNILKKYEVQLLPYYLMNLSAKFHKLYTKYKVISADTELSEERLAVIYAIKRVIAVGLNLLGVSAPESM